MRQGLSTAEAARVVQLSEARVRALLRSGLCGAPRRGRGYALSFQDLVVLRSARELIDQGVPPARVRGALAALARALPEGSPASGLRVWADGRRVAVRAGGSAWEPETGQTLLDFDAGDRPKRIVALRGEADPPDSPRSQGALEAEGWLERALDLEGSDRKAAADAYLRALDLEPDLADAWVHLGRLAHESGDPAEAARMYRLALDRCPDDPTVHFSLALALEDAEAASEALLHYRSALALDPDFAEAHYNLAGLCESLGLREDALRHYRIYARLTAD